MPSPVVEVVVTPARAVEPRASVVEERPAPKFIAPGTGAARAADPAPAANAAMATEAPAPPATPKPAAASARLTAPELWAGVLRAAADNRRLISIIEDFRIERLDGDAAVIVGRGPLVAMARASTEAIGELFARAGGRPIRVEIRADDSPEEAGPDAAAAPVNLEEHPLVKQAMELFGVRTKIRVLPRKREAEGEKA